MREEFATSNATGDWFHTWETVWCAAHAMLNDQQPAIKSGRAGDEPNMLNSCEAFVDAMN
jgi:hypothetical protein